MRAIGASSGSGRRQLYCEFQLAWMVTRLSAEPEQARVDRHVMSAEAAVRILELLDEHDVAACVGGGWAVDALLQQQTRTHSDLDLWLAAPDIEPLFVAVVSVGIDRILPWPGDRPWNFVLHDGARLRIDLHFYEAVGDDQFRYGAFDSNEVFPAAALAGHGVIDGKACAAKPLNGPFVGTRATQHGRQIVTIFRYYANDSRLACQTNSARTDAHRPMISADELLARVEGRSSAIWARRSGSALDEAAGDEDQYSRAFDAFLNRGEAERAVRLVSALRDVWWARGQYTEGLIWIDRVLDLPAVPRAGRATALDQGGALAFAQGDYQRARQYFEASLELRRSGGPTRDLALALNHLAAAVRWGSSDPEVAVPLYEESLALARHTADPLLVGAALMPLGTLALDRGELTHAERLLRDGLTHYIEAEVETAFPLALEQFAALAAARDQGVRALRLAGAGAAWRRILATHPTPYTAWVARYLSVARFTLSQARAHKAWLAGKAMSLKEAIAYSLEDEITN